jgi:hypothetical protein
MKSRQRFITRANWPSLDANPRYRHPREGKGGPPSVSRPPWPKEAVSHVEMGMLDSQRQKGCKSQQAAGQQAAFETAMAASGQPAQGPRQ